MPITLCSPSIYPPVFRQDVRLQADDYIFTFFAYNKNYPNFFQACHSQRNEKRLFRYSLVIPAQAGIQVFIMDSWSSSVENLSLAKDELSGTPA
jgi:hypothetical protein